MALVECTYLSRVLRESTSFVAIVPDDPDEQPGPHRVLWLLHGLSDDHTGWTRYTSIERYVEGRRLAVVMPRVGRSFYADMQRGLRYWQFVSEELPRVARAMFNLSEAREHNFVAGLSMGGYGAFKLAMTHPDRYAAAASLSGALDAAAVFRHHADRFERQELANIFGSEDQIHGSGNDLFHLASELAGSDVRRPRLWMCCGKADHLIPHNRGFHEHLDKVGLDHHYAEHAGEAHAWSYWDRRIVEVLDWVELDV